MGYANFFKYVIIMVDIRRFENDADRVINEVDLVTIKVLPCSLVISPLLSAKKNKKLFKIWLKETYSL